MCHVRSNLGRINLTALPYQNELHTLWNVILTILISRLMIMTNIKVHLASYLFRVQLFHTIIQGYLGEFPEYMWDICQSLKIFQMDIERKYEVLNFYPKKLRQLNLWSGAVLKLIDALFSCSVCDDKTYCVFICLSWASAALWRNKI